MRFSSEKCSTSRLCFLLLTLSLAACGAPEKKDGVPALKDRILFAHPEHPGVLLWTYEDESILKTVEYDLAHEPTRLSLFHLKFTCNLAGDLWFVMAGKDAIEQNEYKTTCVLGICGKPKLVAHRELNFKHDFQRMVDAKTFCHSMDSYPLDEKW